MLDGVDGTTVRMRVTGIADTADQGFYPQWTPGLIWASHGLLSRVEPTPSETTEVVGLRLSDPSGRTGLVSQEVFDAYNGASESSPVERITTGSRLWTRWRAMTGCSASCSRCSASSRSWPRRARSPTSRPAGC